MSAEPAKGRNAEGKTIGMATSATQRMTSRVARRRKGSGWASGIRLGARLPQGCQAFNAGAKGPRWKARTLARRPGREYVIRHGGRTAVDRRRLGGRRPPGGGARTVGRPAAAAGGPGLGRASRAGHLGGG